MIRPFFDAADGHYYWATADGCHFQRMRPPISDGFETRLYRIEWSGGCDHGWISGRGTLRYYQYESAWQTGLRVGTAVNGSMQDEIRYFPVSVNPGNYAIFSYRVAAGREVDGSRKRLERHEAPAELVRSYEKTWPKKAYADASSTPESTTATESKHQPWFTDEEKKGMREFFVELVTGVGKLAEQKAAKKQANNAAVAYDRHISSSGPNTMAHFEKGARLLNEKNRAESAEKKVTTMLARADEFAGRNREVSTASRARGTEAPDGRRCLAKYDEVRMDRKTRELLERGREAELRYVNLCRDVTVDVFHCVYVARGETTSPGECRRERETIVSYERTYEYSLYPELKTHRNELSARAFCPSGSRPTEFEALGSTQTNGLALYNCVWN